MGAPSRSGDGSPKHCRTEQPGRCLGGSEEHCQGREASITKASEGRAALRDEGRVLLGWGRRRLFGGKRLTHRLITGVVSQCLTRTVPRQKPSAEVLIPSKELAESKTVFSRLTALVCGVLKSVAPNRRKVFAGG